MGCLHFASAYKCACLNILPILPHDVGSWRLSISLNVSWCLECIVTTFTPSLLDIFTNLLYFILSVASEKQLCKICKGK